jgi:hypothetical protein
MWSSRRLRPSSQKTGSFGVQMLAAMMAVRRTA